MPQTIVQSATRQRLAVAAAVSVAAAAAGLTLSDGVAALWHGFIYNGFSALPAGLFIC